MERYRAQFHSAFPTADIYKVIPNDADARSLLHMCIDLYLSGIAGYSSSADRLNRRTEQELRIARQFLSKPFFEKYQECAPYRAKISSPATPALFCAMEAAELNRIDLLEEVERLIKPE